MTSFQFKDETNVLDNTARAKAPGCFIGLSDGVVHYELGGTFNNPSVVLVHGFSTPYHIWDPTFKGLTDAGFQTLRYDLYGRGYSDRPHTIYDSNLFDRQLYNLLCALRVNLPLTVVGLSMGGSISATFVDRHPELVDKLILIDPAGFPFPYSLSANLVRLPIIGEWLMDLVGTKTLVNGADADFQRPEDYADYRQKFLPQLQYKGYRQALLSTMRHGVLDSMAETYYRIGKLGKPTLLIWGKNDQTIPFKTHVKFKVAMPHLQFEAIEQSGHLPHYERSEVVNPLLINFLHEDGLF